MRFLAVLLLSIGFSSVTFSMEMDALAPCSKKLTHEQLCERLKAHGLLIPREITQAKKGENQRKLYELLQNLTDNTTHEQRIFISECLKGRSELLHTPSPVVRDLGIYDAVI